MALGLPVPVPIDRLRLWVAGSLWLLLMLVFSGLLMWTQGPELRTTASATGLLIAGLVATGSGLWRAVHDIPQRRRAWILMSLAGALAVASNIWVAVVGADPVLAPSVVSDLFIATAFVFALVGVLSFPAAKRGRWETLLVLVDGLIVGGALLLIVTTVVYPSLLDAPTPGSLGAQILALAFPILDVAMATVAGLLLIRARAGERLLMSVMAAGFVLYAVSDLAYAVEVAKGTFTFGTALDLGWIAGYLTFALTPWLPLPEDARRLPRRSPAGFSDTVGTVTVFAVVIVAASVQLMIGQDGSLQGVAAAVWVVLIGAVALRQLLLVRANARLQRGLETEVLEQTVHLQRLARQTEAMVTSVADGVYVVDQDGRVTFANPSAAAALGYTVEELMGAQAHATFHASGPDGTPYPWSLCYVREAIDFGILSRGELDEYERADGTMFPVEITASPLVEQNVVRGAVVVFRDVTERHEVDRMKDEFLSVVSHELRTPLTSIRGSLGLIAGGRMGELPGSAGALVSVAQQSTERLVRLVDDLLDIERMRTGTEPLRLTRLAVDHLLYAAAHQLEGLADASGITFAVGVAEGHVLGDEDRLMQTLVNLLGNAIKFSPAGATVWMESRCQDDRVWVQIRDEGRGIPPDRLDSVFDRFVQVDSSDTRQKGGTGLGLTISRTIVEQHSGRIWIESALGAGTTVHIDLPQG